MQIISASRRTDIPKFHASWFMGRVREGRVAYRNPFSGHLHEVSLRPEDVRAIVFWSRDYRPLERHLDELDARGFRYVFQFTITGLPRIFEERVPDAETSVATARRLAGRTSPAHVLWRFDPIVISGWTEAEETIERFTRLARGLEGATRRCSISFMQLYAKVRRNMAPLEDAHGLRFRHPAIDEKRAIAGRLATVAAAHGIALVSCCDDALIQAGDGWEVGKGRCVDASLIEALFPDRVAPSKPGPTREACGCALSRDIGAYDTCPHGCFYCYANANPDLARARHAAQDPRALVLGEARSEPASPRVRADGGATRT
jgi:hypothetical protein